MLTPTVSALFRALVLFAVAASAVACSAAESGVRARTPARGALAIVHVQGRGTVESQQGDLRCDGAAARADCRVEWTQVGEALLEATAAPGSKFTGWRVERVTRDGNAVGLLDPSFSSDVEAYSYTAVFAPARDEAVSASASHGM